MKRANANLVAPERDISVLINVVLVLFLWLGLVAGVMHVVLNHNIDRQENLHREVYETKHLASLVYDFKHHYQELQLVLIEHEVQFNETSLQRVSVINKENKNLIRSMEEYLRSWHGFALLNQLEDELETGRDIQKEVVRYLLLQHEVLDGSKQGYWNDHIVRMNKILDELNSYNLSRLESSIHSVFNYQFEYHKSWSQSVAVFFIIAVLMFFYVSHVFVMPLRVVMQKLSLLGDKLQSGQACLSHGASLRRAGEYLTVLESHIDDITEEQFSEDSVGGGVAANENSFNGDTFHHYFDSAEEQVMPISTFNCFSDGVLLLDQKGQILYGNEAALERLEIQRLTDYNREVERYIPSLKRWLATRERGDQIYETALLDSQRKAKPFSARVVSLRVKGQADDCYVIIFDAQKLSEQSVTTTNWAHCITQELQPSIDSIKEDLDLLLQCFGAEGRSKIEALVNDASSHASSTVDVIKQMNEVQKIESGDVTFDYQRHSFCACIDSLTVRCEALCKVKNIQFIYNEPTIEPWVKIDLVHIQEVLILLMKNAIMNSNEGGVIEIKLQDMAQRAFLSVVDYGEPLLGDNIPGIFHAPQSWQGRADPQRDVVLARCKAIIDRHGGKLGYNATPEGRNSIYFNLPICKTNSKFG